MPVKWFVKILLHWTLIFQDQAGESVLERVMRLCREDEEEEERERLKEEEEAMRRWRMGEEMEENGGIVEENTRAAETEKKIEVEKSEEEKGLASEEAIFNVSTEPIERDMFEDSPDEQVYNNQEEEEEIALNSTNIVKQIDFEALDINEDDGFNDDGFDDDLNDGQDSFLIAASQMAEDPVIKEEVATRVNQESVVVEKAKKAATTFKFKRESKVLLPPAVARLQQEGGSDGFGSDDSFDEQMSQLPPGGFGTPASPVLKKRQQSPSTFSNTSSRSPALSTRSRSAVGESIKPVGAALKPPMNPCNRNQAQQQNPVQQSDQSKQTSQTGWKRFSSFDQQTSQISNSSSSASSSTGSSFKRVKSSPVVSQVCLVGSSRSLDVTKCP